MDDSTGTYRLADMSRGVAVMTWILSVLLFGSVGLGVWGVMIRLWPLAGLPVFVALVFGFVWVFYRPRQFEITPEAIRVVFPARVREYSLDDVTACREVVSKDLGMVLRLWGAGGLWGLFGLCWSKKRGKFDAYVSRGDGLVWIEFLDRRPLLISPADPRDFLADLIARSDALNGAEGV